MTGKYTNEPARLEITGAEIVLQALRDNGVEHIFGYPGAAVLPIYDEIFQQTDIKHILVRHEQGAGHAAEGYARSTGKTGVMLVTSGPGATNAVTSLQNAMTDCVPIVCLTGQVATDLIGSDAFQECDTVGITRPCTKHSWLVKDVKDLAATIHKAFHLAQSDRPGPVLVDMPKDILLQSSYYRAPSAVASSEIYSERHEEINHHLPSFEMPAEEMDEKTISPRYALERLHALTRNHSPFITTDMDQHKIWISRFNNVEHPNRWIAPSGFGTMGYGLPAAIGTQIAHPESLVIDISDASSAQASMKELSTAIQYEAPVKVFILNTGRMSLIHGAHREHPVYRSYAKALPDFVKLAEAFGAIGIRCDAPEALDDAIQQMITIKGPVLLDCQVGQPVQH
ncbi:thiamine pyrophosphate-binding protein [Phyllobacterium sp. K27]